MNAAIAPCGDARTWLTHFVGGGLDGSRMQWRRLRQVLDQALEVASDYCARTAPVEHLGRLFVDARERPVEADDATIANGTAVVMTIRDFSGIPAIGGN